MNLCYCPAECPGQERAQPPTLNPFHPAYAPQTCNTRIDELIGCGCFRRAAFALARGCLPPTGTSGLREAHASVGILGDSRLASKPLPGARGLGTRRQEMTDLTQPGRGQYSFLKSK